MKKISCVIALLATLSSCSYNAMIPSSSAADEVLPMRRINANVYLQINDDLENLKRRVRTGLTCAEHLYEIDAGRALSQSLVQTLEGAFQHVIKVDSRSEAKDDGYLIRASLSDFEARIRVNAFFSVTTTATTEIAIRVAVFDQAGDLKYQATLRGESTEEETGGCNTAIDTATDATRKAIREAMEDLVHRLINTGILTE